MRLLCLPYAGAGASAYARWSEHCPPGLELWFGLLPGREDRITESHATNIADLADLFAAALMNLDERPFAIFGHSLGSLISFELVRSLRRIGGRAPIHLFVSGMVAPQLQVSEQPLDDASVLDEVRMLGGTPDALLAEPELMEIMLPVLRADFNLVRSYGYYAEEPLPVPITSLGGLQDPYTTDDGLLAWQLQTRASFASRRWPGGHFYLHDFTSEVVRTIADTLGLSSQASQTQPIGASRTLS